MSDKKIFKKEDKKIVKGGTDILRVVENLAEEEKSRMPKGRAQQTTAGHLYKAFPEGMTSTKYRFAVAYVNNGFKVYDALREMGYSEDNLRGVAGSFTRDAKVQQFVAKVVAEQMERVNLSAEKVVSHIATIMLNPDTPKAEQLKAANMLMKHYNGFEEHQKAGKSSGYTNEELNARIENLTNRLHGKQHGVKKILDQIEQAENVDFTETYDEKPKKSEK